MSESKESKVAVYCGECGRDDLPDEAMAQALRRAIENEDRLTAENERLRRERDNFLELAKEWMAIGHEKSTKQVFEWESRLLAAIEGEKNDK